VYLRASERLCANGSQTAENPLDGPSARTKGALS
jgi:hypothetical protein